VLKRKEEALPFMLFDKVAAKLKLRNKIRYAMDAAASSFYKNGRYKMSGGYINAAGLMKNYAALTAAFGLISIEDPFDEEDFKSFARMHRENKTIVVGDDLTVTNPSRIKRAHATKSINGVIIKPNQIGTLTETIDAAKLAHKFGFKIIASHRSGETKDDWICDVAVGLGAFGIKIGAPKTPYRLAKYKRLAEIKI
jgi:enolase